MSRSTDILAKYVGVELLAARTLTDSETTGVSTGGVAFAERLYAFLQGEATAAGLDAGQTAFLEFNARDLVKAFAAVQAPADSIAAQWAEDTVQHALPNLRHAQMMARLYGGPRQ